MPRTTSPPHSLRLDAGLRYLPVGLLIALCCVTSAHAQQSGLTVGFDDLETDTRPPGLAYLDDLAGASSLRIVGAQTEPGDPFADGDANQSLCITDESDEHRPRIAWPVQAPITQKGTFSIDIYLPQRDKQAGTAPAMLRIALGERRLNEDGAPGSVTDSGLSLYLLEDGRIKTRTPQRMWTLDQSFPTGQPLTLTVRFDVTQQTWTGTLAGVPLTRRKGSTHAHPFAGEIDRVDSVEISAGRRKPLGEHVFIDDLNVQASAE